MASTASSSSSSSCGPASSTVNTRRYEFKTPLGLPKTTISMVSLKQFELAEVDLPRHLDSDYHVAFLMCCDTKRSSTCVFPGQLSLRRRVDYSASDDLFAALALEVYPESVYQRKQVVPKASRIDIGLPRGAWLSSKLVLPHRFRIVEHSEECRCPSCQIGRAHV